MQLGQSHLKHGQLQVLAGHAPDLLLPRTVRDHDTQFMTFGVSADPMRVDECSPAPLPNDHAFVRQLCQCPRHRGATYAIPQTQLVLGGEPAAGAVPSGQDVPDQHRLELEVEWYRVLAARGARPQYERSGPLPPAPLRNNHLEEQSWTFFATGQNQRS